MATGHKTTPRQPLLEAGRPCGSARARRKAVRADLGLRSWGSLAQANQGAGGTQKGLEGLLVTSAALGLPSRPQSPAWEWSWPCLPFADPSLLALGGHSCFTSNSAPLNTHTGGGKASAPTSHSKKREGGDVGAFGRYLWKPPEGSGDVNQPCSLPVGTEPALVSRGGWWGNRGTCHPGTCLSRSPHLSSGRGPSFSSLLKALRVVNITAPPSIPSHPDLLGKKDSGRETHPRADQATFGDSVPGQDREICSYASSSDQEWPNRNKSGH